MALRRGLYVRKDGSGLGTVPADARLAHPAAYRQGVFYTDSGASAVSGTSGWTYSVAAAKYAVSDGAGGFYLFANDGPAETPVVQASPGSGSRWDLIYVLQRDPDVSGTSSLPVFGVESGDSGGTPTKPYGKVPAGALVVAEAQVGAGATSTSHANVTITPVFPWTAAPGSPIPVRSTSERNALTATAVQGLRAYRLDTGATEEFRDGSWDTVSQPGVWMDYTPEWTSSGTTPSIGNGTRVGRYKMIGRTVTFVAEITIGSTTNLGTGTYLIGLPTSRLGTASRFPLTGVMRTAAGVYYALAPVSIVGNPNASIFQLQGNGTLAGVTGSSPAALTAGATLTITGTYEAS